MTDTNKATPRPWEIDGDNPTLVFSGASSLSGLRYIANFDSTVYGFNGAGDEARARQAIEAINSYNPERDKLARELAEMIRDLSNGSLRTHPWNAFGAIVDKARQLLKLYEQEGRPSTLPGG